MTTSPNPIFHAGSGTLRWTAATTQPESRPVLRCPEIPGKPGEQATLAFETHGLGRELVALYELRDVTLNNKAHTHCKISERSAARGSCSSTS